MFSNRIYALDTNQFWNAKPFPHVCVDNFLDTEFALLVANEFPEYECSQLKGYDNSLEHKKLLNHWDHFGVNTYKLITALNSDQFISRFVTGLTREDSIFADHGLNGAGLFIHSNGGRLNPHLDYDIHPKLGLQRRFNLLIYLTPSWCTEWHGDFVMYDFHSSSRHGSEIARISPLFNRAIFFETTNNWHGVPDALRLPYGVTRNAIGIFYLSSDLSIDANDAKKKALYSPLSSQLNDSDVTDLIRRRADPDLCKSVYE